MLSSLFALKFVSIYSNVLKVIINCITLNDYTAFYRELDSVLTAWKDTSLTCSHCGLMCS